MQLFDLKITRYSRCEPEIGFSVMLGHFQVCPSLLWERAAMTFSGTTNNRDIKAEIMGGSRRNQRTVKLNMQQTTLWNHGEDWHCFRCRNPQTIQLIKMSHEFWFGNSINDCRTNNTVLVSKRNVAVVALKSVVFLNWSCSFSLSLLQVFLITLVQLVSKQLQRNYMNAWCFALPIVPPFTIQPWTWCQVFISDSNLPTKDHSTIVD